MSFDSRDLAFDVLPAAFDRPGLQMCAQATAGGLDEEEEEDDLECAQATAGDSDSYVPAEGLALLRRQLRQRLTAQEGA